MIKEEIVSIIASNTPLMFSKSLSYEEQSQQIFSIVIKHLKEEVHPETNLAGVIQWLERELNVQIGSKHN